MKAIILALSVFTFILFLMLALIRKSPREKLLNEYNKKRCLAQEAFDKSDMESYQTLNREASELIEMILRLERDSCFKRRGRF